MGSLQHPAHGGLLKPYEWIQEDSSFLICDLCQQMIAETSTVYKCGVCRTCIHKRCAEAPLEIRHPFHPEHSLSLIHRPHPCSADNPLWNAASSYRCGECGYDVKLDWALCTLPDEEAHPTRPVGETLQVAHEHPLTPFSAKWECQDCSICELPIEGDGYICFSSECDFIIHGKCLQYLRYEDGTSIPLVKHGHQFTTLRPSKDTDMPCSICELKISGEYIACRVCDLFFHRDCANVPNTLQHPLYQNSPLTLCVALDWYNEVCNSCRCLLREGLAYESEDEELYLHSVCALRTFEYLEKGESAEISTCLHEHPMLLCHRLAEEDTCSACKDNIRGLAYRCVEEDCSWLLHKSCAQQMPRSEHPHHPKHALTLVPELSFCRYKCSACNEKIEGYYFSCTTCTAFYMDFKCVLRRPTQKHYLHEHDLADFSGCLSLECNVCGTDKDSTIFRCVPCDFSIHKKCMELPQTVTHGSYHHVMTLSEYYVDDDSGEYYCDLCEERRDHRLGVYICQECKMQSKFVAHIWCALKNMNLKKTRDPAVRKIDVEIADLEGKVRLKKAEQDAIKEQLTALEEQLKKAREERAKLMLEADG